MSSRCCTPARESGGPGDRRRTLGHPSKCRRADAEPQVGRHRADQVPGLSGVARSRSPPNRDSLRPCEPGGAASAPRAACGRRPLTSRLAGRSPVPARLRSAANRGRPSPVPTTAPVPPPRPPPRRPPPAPPCVRRCRGRSRRSPARSPPGSAGQRWAAVWSGLLEQRRKRSINAQPRAGRLQIPVRLGHDLVPHREDPTPAWPTVTPPASLESRARQAADVDRNRRRRSQIASGETADETGTWNDSAREVVDQRDRDPLPRRPLSGTAGSADARGRDDRRMAP